MVEIVEGRYYKTRDGRKVGPMRKVGYGWVADSGRIMASDYIDWYSEGNYHYYNETSHDLIEEYKDDTQLFKVGDRVKKKDGTSFSNYEMFVNVTEVKNGCVWLTTGYHLTPERLELANEQIVIKEKFVGEQSSSPVQSRKTLVPGVYGRLRVGETGLRNDEQTVSVFASNYHTAQELREMIRVLGDIVEFLEEVK